MYKRAKAIQVQKSDKELNVENMRRHVQRNTIFKNVSQMSLKRLTSLYKHLC